MLSRVIDNSKKLSVTGIKRSEPEIVHEGLKRELSALPDDAFRADTAVRNRLMDAYIERHNII